MLRYIIGAGHALYALLTRLLTLIWRYSVARLIKGSVIPIHVCHIFIPSHCLQVAMETKDRN